MVRHIFGVLFVLAFGCAPDKELISTSINLIPQPNKVEVYDGHFNLLSNTSILANSTSELANDLIKEYISGISGITLEVNDNQSNCFQFEIDTSYNNEEYHLSVNKNSVLIKGGSEIALLHSIQSIRQLLLKQQQDYQLPIMELHDQSRFEWRGLLLDCSRHFMEKAFVKRYIDLLALHKMNVLHWHLTEDQGWRIEIKKYPELTEIGAWRDDGKGGKYGGFYSQDDIKEVVSYATSRGITVVPEIELPGHSQAALATYPHLSCTDGPFDVANEWGVFKDIYCAGNEETFEFLENVLTEVMELFPSEYIHIGGDEAPKYRWEHCNKCQKRIVDEGLKDEHELQSYFIKRIEKFINSKGKQIIGWDEILEGGLAPGATVQSWRGFEGAAEAARQGNKAIVSPTSHAYFDYGLNDIDMEKVYDFEPVPDGLSIDEAKLIIGGECNMWSERAPQNKVDSKVFPRILAMAEVLWSDRANRNFDEFKSRVQSHYSILNKLEVDYGFETVPVKATTYVDNDTLWAKLIGYDDQLEIHYHSNEYNNQKYYAPISISSPSEISITFAREGKFYKDTIRQTLLPHFANGIVPDIKTIFNKNYTAGGATGLTDGKKGSTKFRDGNWQGYWGDDIEVVIDLGEIKQIESFSSGYLQYNNAWIFYPTLVEYYYSEDGKKYTKAGEVRNTIPLKNKAQTIKNFSIRVYPKDARYVKMVASNVGECPDWHDAAGSKTWLFIDEFAVY